LNQKQIVNHFFQTVVVLRHEKQPNVAEIDVAQKSNVGQRVIDLLNKLTLEKKTHPTQAPRKKQQKKEKRHPSKLQQR